MKAKIKREKEEVVNLLTNGFFIEGSANGAGQPLQHALNPRKCIALYP